MKRIKANLKMIFMVFKYSPMFAIMAIVMIAVDVFETLLGLYILEHVIELIENNNSFDKVLMFIVVSVALQTFCMAFRSIYNGYIRTKGRNVWVKKIQGVIYKKAKEIDISYFDDPKLYDKFSRALKQSDIKSIDCFESIITLISALCSVLSLAIYMVVNVPELFIVAILTSLVTFFCYYKMNKLGYALYKDVEVHEREIAYVNRTFYLEKNAYDLKTTNMALLLLEKKHNTYLEYDKKYRKCENKERKYRFGEDLIYQIVVNFVTYAYLMKKVYDNLLTIGEFTALSASVWKFINRFYSFSRSIANLGDKFQYVEDFLWLMNYEANIENSKKKHSDFDFEVLKFENLSFKYPNQEEYALNNISLQINKGEKIAIIGYNGAGKTTLTKLLLKLYEPASGKIYINNIDYDNLSAFDVREKSSIILQNFQIYSATILENVLMRKKMYCDDEEVVIEALKKVGLYDKVMSFKDGLNTVLTKEFSNDGVELSGGERQKLAIARVFASKANIAILDEPTSALDPLAEKEINDKIIKMGDEKTIIIISHRLSTIVNVDKIYVMGNGCILESGTHYELMKLNGVYNEMFSAQAELYIEK